MTSYDTTSNELSAFGGTRPPLREGFSDWADLGPDEEQKLNEVWDRIAQESQADGGEQEPAA